MFVHTPNTSGLELGMLCCPILYITPFYMLSSGNFNILRIALEVHGYFWSTFFEGKHCVVNEFCNRISETWSPFWFRTVYLGPICLLAILTKFHRQS